MFIETEDTSNPETLRFLPGRPVAPTGPLDFPNVESSIRSPLAQQLFRIEGVTGIVLDSESITVRRSDDKDWQSLKPAILAVIMEHFIAGRPVLLEEASEDAANEAGEDDQVATEIKELIDTRIRPAAMETGGDVTFRGYKDGIVYVDMQGSGFSLREGMISVLRHYVPGVVDVRDYSDAIPKPGMSTPEAAAIQRLLDERINPAVAAHGGHVSLVDVQEDTTYIRLEGGCQGCGMADVTLKQGIETEIKQVVPAIKAVLDVTDHAGGTNPYYQPGKGGASPF